MAIDDKIRNEKLQHDINREAAKVPALSSGKINKYEYLTGEEKYYILNQRKLMQQGNFTYSLLGKAFGKQTKRIEEHLKDTWNQSWKSF